MKIRENIHIWYEYKENEMCKSSGHKVNIKFEWLHIIEWKNQRR